MRETPSPQHDQPHPFWLIGVAWYANRVEVFRFAQTGSGPDAYLNFRTQARDALHFRFIAASPNFGTDVVTEMKAFEH